VESERFRCSNLVKVHARFGLLLLLVVVVVVVLGRTR
jgi:hypothetical protein